METLLFTTVQNKSGKDIIAPVCFRYNLSSYVMAPLVSCNSVRIKGSLWGRQETSAMTVVKISMTTFFLHFISATDTNFTNNQELWGWVVFDRVFFSNQNKRQHQESFYIKDFLLLSFQLQVLGKRFFQAKPAEYLCTYIQLKLLGQTPN